MSTILEISRLTKRFGGVSAVKDLDIVVNEGEILGLIGPNAVPTAPARAPAST